MAPASTPSSTGRARQRAREYDEQQQPEADPECMRGVHSPYAIASEKQRRNAEALPTTTIVVRPTNAAYVSASM